MKEPFPSDFRVNSLPVLQQLASRLRSGASLAGNMVALAAALCSFSTVAADDPDRPPFITDRPGAYCGSLTVPKGFVHVETGFAYERSDENSDLSTPFVLRIGLRERLEFRAVTSGFNRQRLGGAGDATTEEGFGGAGLGLKWQFFEPPEESSGPSMALIFSLNLPVGSDFARPDRAEPGLVWATDIGLPAQFWLTTNAGVSAPYDGSREDRFAQLFLAAALSREVAPRTSVFVEVFGSHPDSSQDGQEQILLDGGVTYLAGPDLQLDFSATRGLSGSATEWAVGAGVSLRFR